MKSISVEQARAIDRDAVTRLKMPSILLMENASRGVAEHAAKLGARHVVLCGPGNNGGDGLAAARHLGPDTRVHLLAEPDPDRCPDASLQLGILRAAGHAVTVGRPPASAEFEGHVWIDALFGTGLTRPLRGEAAQWVEVFNAGRRAEALRRRSQWVARRHRAAHGAVLPRRSHRHLRGPEARLAGAGSRRVCRRDRGW